MMPTNEKAAYKKILVIGPPGSGKSFVSEKLRKLGHNAVDADSLSGLSKWVDQKGNEVEFPECPDIEWLETHEFVWDRDVLKGYLEKKSLIFLFGVSHNIFEMIDLFDKAYYLSLDPKQIRTRMMSKNRLNVMGKTKQQQQEVIKVIWELNEKARLLNLEFIDASLSSKQIFCKISK